MAAGLQDAALHGLGALPKMRVAGRNIAPGVNDADHRLAHEIAAPQSHLLQTLTVGEAAHVVGREPALAAKIGDAHHAHSPLMFTALATHGQSVQK